MALAVDFGEDRGGGLWGDPIGEEMVRRVSRTAAGARRKLWGSAANQWARR